MLIYKCTASSENVQHVVMNSSFQFFRTSSNIPSRSQASEQMETESENESDKENCETSLTAEPEIKKRKVDRVDQLLGTCENILRRNETDECTHFSN